jgi:hypothetical protein
MGITFGVKAQYLHTIKTIAVIAVGRGPLNCTKYKAGSRILFLTSV